MSLALPSPVRQLGGAACVVLASAAVAAPGAHPLYLLPLPARVAQVDESGPEEAL